MLFSQGLENAFSNGLIFTDDTLEKSSLENLIALTDRLKKYKQKVVTHKILDKVNQFVIKKQQQQRVLESVDEVKSPHAFFSQPKSPASDNKINSRNTELSKK